MYECKARRDETASMKMASKTYVQGIRVGGHSHIVGEWFMEDIFSKSWTSSVTKKL